VSKINLLAACFLCILGALFGGMVGYNIKECPQYAKSNTVDTLIVTSKAVHDTIRLTSKQISVRVDTVKVYAQVFGDSLRDTTTCYTFQRVEPDGAEIKVGVCADSLPKRPINLFADIQYKAPPCSSKTIFRVASAGIIAGLIYTQAKKCWNQAKK